VLRVQQQQGVKAEGDEARNNEPFAEEHGNNQPSSAAQPVSDQKSRTGTGVRRLYYVRWVGKGVVSAIAGLAAPLS
jgi:hypothetical protein